MNSRITEEYRQKEQEFMATPALCDHVDPRVCDCSKCPAKDLCDWLCANAN